jgi:hypothetical protein
LEHASPNTVPTDFDLRKRAGTTDANELVAEIHDRMPLILAPADSSLWLSDEPDPHYLMVPFPAEPMRMCICLLRVIRFFNTLSIAVASTRNCSILRSAHAARDAGSPDFRSAVHTRRSATAVSRHYQKGLISANAA